MPDPVMSQAHSLQLALHRRQSACIARTLGEKDAPFRRYEARYRRRARSVAEILPREALLDRALASDVLHVGDYHTLPQAQALFLELVQRAQVQARPLVLALECVEGRFQPLLERWRSGTIDADTFFEQLEAARPEALALWPTFRALLTWAVEAGIPVLAIDLRTRAADALNRRDAYAASRIAETLRQQPGARVLVLSGQFHVAPCHLPAALTRALGTEATRVVQRTLFQNCEAPYFELLGRGHDPLAMGAELAGGALCAFTASPTLAQRTFLDYLEAGDASVFAARGDVHREIPGMVRRLAGVLGIVRGGGAATAPTDGLLVVPAGAPDVLAQLAGRARFAPDELRALGERLRRGESLYVPQATAVCLTSLSMSDAAFEAARHLRHRALGAEVPSARDIAGSFYARVWEVALGHFGARLVAPAPASEGLAAWSRSLREGTGELRRVAAFVLTHKALETARSREQLDALALPRSCRVVDAIARALGSLLGEGLARAWREDVEARASLRALFVDPLASPREDYLSWVARLTPARRRRPTGSRAPSAARAS